jgi:hypothetical protein
VAEEEVWCLAVGGCEGEGEGVVVAGTKTGELLVVDAADLQAAVTQTENKKKFSPALLGRVQVSSGAVMAVKAGRVSAGPSGGSADALICGEEGEVMLVSLWWSKQPEGDQMNLEMECVSVFCGVDEPRALAVSDWSSKSQLFVGGQGVCRFDLNRK